MRSTIPAHQDRSATRHKKKETESFCAHRVGVRSAFLPAGCAQRRRPTPGRGKKETKILTQLGKNQVTLSRTRVHSTDTDNTPL